MRILTPILTAAISTVLAVTMMYPQTGYALGLGRLSVQSNLGEPLKMQIQLESVNSIEAETLDVTLASRSDFSRAGVEYPIIAELLDFDLQQTADGRYVVDITTQDPVTDTYLHLMVSALWSGGKAVREYTALLDPPLYSGQQPAEVSIASTETTSGAEDVAEQGVSSRAVPSSGGSSSGGSSVAGDVITVNRGDTLSQIVNDIDKPSNIDYFQALESVFRRNPQAFIDNNMNLLRSGASLTVPSFGEMAAIPRNESLASFTEQLERFNAYQASVRAKQESDSSDTLTEIIEQAVVQEEQAAVTEEVSNLEIETRAADAAAEEVEQSVAGEDLPDEESGEATLTIGQQIGDETAIDGGDNAAQLETLRSQLAQLDESLLASGVESDSVKQNLKQIQDQVARLSTLIEVEDSSLAMAQNRAADAAIADTNESAAAVEEVSDAAQAEVDPTQAQIDQAASDLGQALEEASKVAAEEVDESANAAVEPEASVEEEVSNESEQVAEAVTSAMQGSDTATTLGAEMAPASQEQDEAEAPLVAATEPVDGGETEETDVSEDSGEGAIGSTVRSVAKSNLLDSVKGMFSTLPEYGLKIAAGLLALLAGLFFWQRRKSRAEFDASMLDIETEEVSMNSETSIQKMTDASGIDLASANDSALELTIGGGMSYLSEEGITGVNEEENEVIKAGAVDPLAEADVYLAYDRDEQAIQVLKEAFADDPERGELAEKLLEIYHKQDDRRAFDALAAELHKRSDSTKNFSWDKIVGMGREVSPDNELYSGEVPKTAESATTIDFDDDMLMPEENVAETLDLGSGDIDMLSTGSQNSAVRSLEIEDLDIDLEAPAAEKADAGLDAPTLSEIISENVEGKLELPESLDLDTENDEISLGGELELGLGDDDKQFNLIEEQSRRAVAEAEKQVDAAVSLDQESPMSEMSGMSEASMSKLEPYHESETALELAKAYLELGEQEIAKGFIEEVLNEGSEKQKGKARSLIKELAS